MNGVYVTKPKPRRPSGREAIDYMHHESPSHYQYSESPARRSIGESPFHRHSVRSATNGGAPLKPKIADSPIQGLNENPENGSSEHGTKGHHHHGQGQSPLHRSYHGRQGSKLQATSPARKRNASEGGGTVFAPLTPRRSKMGANTRPDETGLVAAPSEMGIISVVPCLTEVHLCPSLAIGMRRIQHLQMILLTYLTKGEKRSKQELVWSRQQFKELHLISAATSKQMFHKENHRCGVAWRQRLWNDNNTIDNPTEDCLNTRIPILS